MLRVKNLTKFYEQDQQKIFALHEVSFDLPEATSMAICGSSGAGKSTLLNLIGGLDQPSEGQVWIDDRSLFTLNAKEEAAFRNSHLGFVFQFHHLLQDFSILENVMMPLLIRNTAIKVAREKAKSMLAQVGIATLQNRHAKELSGGEQQRAAIARALVTEPKLILADEPTGNLDDANGAVVFDLLCQLNHDLGATLIVVTHSLNFARKLGHIMTLNAGRVESFVANDALERQNDFG